MLDIAKLQVIFDICNYFMYINDKRTDIDDEWLVY